MKSLRPFFASCGFPLAILVFFIVGAFAYVSALRLSDASRASENSLRMLEAIAKLDSNLLGIENGASGFALTGDKAFLERYERRVEQKERLLARLQELTRGDSQQKARMDSLEPLIARVCEANTQVVSLGKQSQTENPDAARQIVLRVNSEKWMEQIHKGFLELNQCEAERLEENSKKETWFAMVSQNIILIGTVGGIIMVGSIILLLKRDIALRLSTEGKLLVQNALMTELISHLPESVYVKDAKGRFTLANRVYRKLLTGSEEGVVEGKTVYDFMSPRASEEVDLDDQAVIRCRQPLSDRVERVMDMDGNVSWRLTTKVPLFDAAGRFSQLLGMQRDITDFRKFQEESKKLKAVMEATAQTRRDFLANMSHEIRTPMNGILGMTDLVLDTPLSPGQREYILDVRNSAQAMLDVLNEIADFSKGSANSMELDPARFDFRALLDGVLTPLTVRADDKRVKMTSSIPDSIPRWLIGDAGRLRQVLVNLVSNAIKFTDRGKVSVVVEPESLAADRCMLRFTVSDTGIGIAEAQRQKIFDAFFQVDSSATRHFGGMGLGLTISAQIVKLMGGRIWLESEEGRGSTFYFTAEFGIAEAPQLTKDEAPLLEGVRVLIVDPDFLKRMTLEEMFLRWRFKPVMVGNGAAAMMELWEGVQNNAPFSLVVSDADMPEMDGFKLAGLIRREHEFDKTGIVLMVSSLDAETRKRAGESGVSHALLKPFDPTALRETLDLIAQQQEKEASRHPVVSPETPETPAQIAPALEPAPSAPAPVSAVAVDSTPAFLATEPEAEQQGPRHPGPLHILIAEDNRINQAVAEGILRKQGYLITIANNGAEALEVYRTKPIDLILMDVQMPEMDGLAATLAIRRIEAETGRHIPIIAVTAHAMKGDRERCLASGMDDYLSKPFNKAKLLEMMESYRSEIVKDASGAGGTHAATAVAESVATQEDKPQEGEAKVVVAKFEELADIMGSPDLVKPLVNLFLKQTPIMLGEIETAVNARDAQGINRAAHAIKGSLGNFGARTAMKMAHSLEIAGKSEELAGVEDLAKALRAEAERVMSALAKYE